MVETSTLRRVKNGAFAGIVNGRTISVRVMHDADMGEFIVQVTQDGKRRERADYYTGDRTDALCTARLMCGLSAT